MLSKVSGSGPGQSAGIRQQPAQGGSSTPIPGGAGVTPPGETPLDPDAARRVREMLDDRGSSRSRRGSDASRGHALATQAGTRTKGKDVDTGLEQPAAGARPEVDKGKGVAPPSPTGSVAGAPGIELRSMDRSRSERRGSGIGRSPTPPAAAPDLPSEQEQRLQLFAGALRLERQFMTDQDRLQAICDDVNRLVDEAVSAVEGTKNEPDLDMAIEALKKVMDHPSQDAADQMNQAIASNPEGAAEKELALAHHGRQVSGTMDLGNTEKAKVYHTANFVGNVVLQPAPSLIPAIFGQGPAASLSALGGSLANLIGIPAAHTLSHLCEITAESLLDNGACNLRPNEGKSMARAGEELALALEDAKRRKDDGDINGARALVEEALKEYRNCKGGAAINELNQLPQSYYKTLRMLGNVGAAYVSYLGYPAAALGAAAAAAWGGQLGLMHGSEVGGMAKEHQKLKMFLKLFHPITPQHIIRHFSAPLQTRAKLASEVVQSQIGQLEQQIAEAQGFHSKAVQGRHEQLRTRQAALTQEIPALATEIQARSLELGMQSEGVQDEGLRDLLARRGALLAEQTATDAELQMLEKDRDSRLRKLAREHDAEHGHPGPSATRWSAAARSVRATAADMARSVGAAGRKAASLAADASGRAGRMLGAGGMVEGLNILKEEMRIYATDVGEGRDLDANRATLAALMRDLETLRNLHAADDPQRRVLELSDESKATLELFASTMNERGQASHRILGSLKHRPEIARAAMRHGFAKAKNPAEIARMSGQKVSSTLQLFGVAGGQSPQLLGGATKVASAFGRALDQRAWWMVQGAGMALSVVSNFRTPDLIHWKHVVGPELRRDLADNKIRTKYGKWAPVTTAPTVARKVFANGLESGFIANFVGIGGSISRTTGLSLSSKTGWRSSEAAAEKFLETLSA